ncbi:MAG: hypothetical protein WA708_18220 [Acidobacteriaceae bacterium]
MADWTAKDKAAEQAEEMAVGTGGGAENMREFAASDYTGPSWNVFADWWKWIKRKVGRGKAH